MRQRVRRSAARGQSLVEMAIILPFLLGLAGGATDLARSYQAWLTVESAARNAAEYLATTETVDPAAAQAEATRIVCLESQGLPGFVAGTGANPTETCTSPAVTATLVLSTSAPGTGSNPLGTAHVSVTLQFTTLVPWPTLPHGSITLSAERTFSVIRGR